jgi:hypothetical protein
LWTLPYKSLFPHSDFFQNSCFFHLKSSSILCLLSAWHVQGLCEDLRRNKCRKEGFCSHLAPLHCGEEEESQTNIHITPTRCHEKVWVEEDGHTQKTSWREWIQRWVLNGD